MDREKVISAPPGEDGAQADALGGGLREDFRYLLESAMGKYTLETYLEVLGMFTDGEIRSGLERGLLYRGGEAVFALEQGGNAVSAAMCLHFQDREGEWVRRSAERRLKKSRFTTETLRQLEEAGELRFEIQPPEEVEPLCR